MMRHTRRAFLAQAIALPLVAQELKRPPAHTLTVIEGTPRERGRKYGSTFKDEIQLFLDREIYAAFTKKAPTREEVLRYGAACAKAIRAYSPEIIEEMEGMAEGAGLSLEALTVSNLHEELYHKGVLPQTPHCTAIAAGPPETTDGHTYVGQTWDWMPSVYGMSRMLHWKRTEGPSVLSYAYPGLWAGAGLNSAGIGHAWTSAGFGLGAGPAIGIPSYVLIAQLLYQKTLKDVVEEARRAGHAGWFTFVMANGEGNLLNLEGKPGALAVEWGRGTMVRVGYGSKELSTSLHGRVKSVNGRLAASKGKVDRDVLGRCFADHGGDGRERVCCHPSTIDVMLYDCAAKEAHLSRGPACDARWTTFKF
ncbi:MAG TPA: C45 family peptidase [Planctomycetota bacterium]